MTQQIIALLVIIFFLVKLFIQKKQKKINGHDFIFWFLLWLSAGFAILLLRWIDKLALQLGFSANGIELLLYIGIVALFYLVFSLRLKVEKLDRDLTKLTREIALKNKE